MLRYLLLSMVWLCWFASPIAAQVPKISTFDPREELKVQIERVQEGRKTIIRDFNTPSDVAGVVYACEVADQATGKVELKGTPYPTKVPLKLTVDGLNKPQVRQFVLEKGGKLAAPFIQVSGDKKHLISSQVFEHVRIETDRVLDPKLQKDIEATLRIAGRKTGDSYCYIYSVSSYIAEIRIDQHTKVQGSSSGIFTLTGEGSYLRNDNYLDRGTFATVIASRYEIQPEKSDLKPIAPSQSEVVMEKGELVAPSKELLELGSRALGEASMSRERAEAIALFSLDRDSFDAEWIKKLAIDPEAASKLNLLSESDREALMTYNEMNWNRF